MAALQASGKCSHTHVCCAFPIGLTPCPWTQSEILKTLLMRFIPVDVYLPAWLLSSILELLEIPCFWAHCCLWQPPYWRPAEAFARICPAGKKVCASIRPEDVEVFAELPQATENVFKGKIVHKAYLGNLLFFFVSVNDTMIRVQAPHNLPQEEGQEIYLFLNPKKCVVLVRWRVLLIVVA